MRASFLQSAVVALGNGIAILHSPPATEPLREEAGRVPKQDPESDRRCTDESCHLDPYH